MDNTRRCFSEAPPWIITGATLGFKTLDADLLLIGPRVRSGVGGNLETPSKCWCHDGTIANEANDIKRPDSLIEVRTH